MQLQAALDRFTIQLRADGRSAHTIRQYTRHVRCLARWCADVGHSGHVEDLGHETLARFMNASVARTRPDGRRKRETSVNALRTSLRVFFGYLHRAGLIPDNPARLLRHARCAPPPPRALTENEQRRLLQALADAEGCEAQRDHMLFDLLLGTGLRLGAAVGLDVEDLDLERAEVHVHQDKGGRPKVVFVPPRVVKHLRVFLAERASGPLFARRDGQRISVRQVQRRLGYWLLRADVERRATVHSLRHTFAVAVYRRTRDLNLTRRALHHRSIVSTTIYAEVDDRDVQRAVSFLAV